MAEEKDYEFSSNEWPHSEDPIYRFMKRLGVDRQRYRRYQDPNFFTPDLIPFLEHYNRLADLIDALKYNPDEYNPEHANVAIEAAKKYTKTAALQQHPKHWEDREHGKQPEDLLRRAIEARELVEREMRASGPSEYGSVLPKY